MRTMKSFSLLFMVAMMMMGCSKTDLYQGNNEEPDPEPTPVKPEANLFDFSTTQSVNLGVDYSANYAGAVFFSIYAEYPMSDDTDPVLRTDIQPVFESFTNISGIFNETVTLPAYAEHLYIYTGNFFVKDQLLECDVIGGSAKVTAKASPAATRGAFAMTRGEATRSLETLYQLSFLVDWKTGDKIADSRIYKDWHTPLGTWDADTGTPNYLMTSDNASYNKLAFTTEEMAGIKQTISNTLTNKKTCDTRYRQPYDLILDKKSEVAVTVVGGNTCWNSTMGYYYYTADNVPTKPEDLNIIMLFPNTQDGQSTLINGKSGSNKYNGNIALQPGDMVQLIYYPNIANNDYSGATTEFPEGMRIGFILKSNGWGMQKTVGDKKYYNIYKGDLKNSNVGRQYNSWASSTEGLSYSTNDPEQNTADAGTYKIPNTTGQARTAKFAYQNAEGQQYAIVSFEDACNDDDYDDFILALKPVGVFEELPRPDEKVTKALGVYAYEDLWPSAGDYDMNDAVVDFSQVWHWKTLDVNVSQKIYKEVVNLTTYQNYVTLKSGLAVTIKNQVKPSSVKMKTIKGADVKEVTFTTETEEDGSTVYLLTDDITGTLGTQFVIEFEYSDWITEKQKIKAIKPFIYRTEGDGRRWEVHVPFEAPTSKMNTSYFGTEDDLSVPSEGNYYIGDGKSIYPFAYFLSGVTIEPFKNTILLRENEKTPISTLYPKFLGWSTSKGKDNKDWYK